MSDLAKRLRIKAGMIEMGEKIAWGSDSALMREAADALEMAAPAVQEEPVAYMFADEWGRTKIVLGKETAEHWAPPGGTIEPLYTSPQPAEQQPDVAQLVKALEALLEVRVVEADASYGLACAKAEHALAAYRKGG